MVADATRPSVNLDALRLTFWACWAGAVSFPTLTFLRFALWDYSDGWELVLVTLGGLTTFGLCLVSTLCAKHDPKLARLGIISLGCGWLVSCLIAGILCLFYF
jgi:hypothetical protein